MLVAILGRQSALSVAELEQYFGAEKLTPSKLHCMIDTDTFDIHQFGGTQKIAKQLTHLENTTLEQAYDYIQSSIPDHLKHLPEGKLKLGISVYGFEPKPKWQLHRMLDIKKAIRAHGRSVRIIENKSPALGAAQVLYNKLTDKLGWELLVIRDGKDVVLAQTLAVQDIDAYAHRDYERPARDARVGMLPPKLAQIMINLATNGDRTTPVYDPFCGTGVVLQEACLLGHAAAGSDLEPRMIEFTEKNLEWLNLSVSLSVADAQDVTLPDGFTGCSIVSEMYLGEPLNSPPHTSSLRTLLNENSQLLQATLKNFARQLNANTRLCIAIPAWKQKNRFVSVLDHDLTVDDLKKLGYTVSSFMHSKTSDLIYARPDQVVGRQLLVLRRNDE